MLDEARALLREYPGRFRLRHCLSQQRPGESSAALAATEAPCLNALTGASRLSTAPGSARQAQAQAVRGHWSERGERALKQRREIAKEWDRQTELSLRRKGMPQDQSCRSNPRQHSAADWAVIS